MGEFAAPNDDPRLGSTKWADWTNQASNLALIASQARLLFPVQEMMPFQRQIFHQNAEIVSAQGQTERVTAVVPDGQAWRLRSITVLHTDTAPKTFRLIVVSGLNVNITANYVGRDVTQNVITSLYPAGVSVNSALRFAPSTGPPIEAFPRDTVQVRSNTATAAAGGAQTNVILEWELIPLPLADNLSELFVGAVS